MTMVDVVLVVVIAGIIVAASWYVIKAKKSGAKCIGCPVSKCCSHHNRNTASPCSCQGCHTKGSCHGTKQ